MAELAEPKMMKHFQRCVTLAELMVPPDCDAPEGRDVIVFLAAMAVDAIMTGKTEGAPRLRLRTQPKLRRRRRLTKVEG